MCDINHIGPMPSAFKDMRDSTGRAGVHECGSTSAIFDFGIAKGNNEYPDAKWKFITQVEEGWCSKFDLNLAPS